MTEETKTILEYTRGHPEGALFCARELMCLGKDRAAVYRALSLLVRRRKLMRVARGLYTRPVETKFGTRSPSVSRVIGAFANLRGETIVPHGVAAANVLGLSTQVPVREIYLTSGRSRCLQLGAQTVELRHAPPWQLAPKSRRAGETIRALAWLGPEHASDAVRALKQKLTREEIAEIGAAGVRAPKWLAGCLSELTPSG